MIVNKITSLVNTTAEITNFSPEITSDVVGHALRFANQYLRNPTKAGLRITYFGVFRPHKRALNAYLLRLLKRLRALPEDAHEERKQMKETFSKFWQLRRSLQQDSERRNFKKRYGNWHWK